MPKSRLTTAKKLELLRAIPGWVEFCSKSYFEAYGMDNEVAVWRCPHQHKSPEAALKCGHKHYGTPRADGTIPMEWHFGGVRRVTESENHETYEYIAI